MASTAVNEEEEEGTAYDTLVAKLERADFTLRPGSGTLEVVRDFWNDEEDEEGEPPGIGLKAFVEFLQSLTSPEIWAWTSASPGLCFAAHNLRGNLARLHTEFYNSEEDLREALEREGADAACLELVQWLCDFPFETSCFLPHNEYPLLDYSDEDECGRCGQVGYRCTLCGSHWCDDDVDHRLHYMDCSRGYSHVRRNRTARGLNTL
jgi:hypothetical protein